MLVFFIASSFSVDVIRTFKQFPYPDNKVYDDAFRVRTSNIENTADYVRVATNFGQYKGQSFTYVIDGNKDTYWESGSVMNDESIVILNLSFVGHKMEDITRITMLDRMSANKGFPLKFDIYISENETTELNLICSVDISSNKHQQYAQFDIPKSTFGFMQFSITKIYGNEGRPNIAEIGFYKEDKIDILKNRMFTDGTWSKLGISIAEAKEFSALIESYPLKDSLENVHRVMRDVVMNGKELGKSVFELEDLQNFNGGNQHGSYIYASAPLGVYLHSEESLEIFCDFDTVNVPWMESLKYLDKNGDFKSGGRNIQNGYNLFKSQKLFLDDLTITTSFISLLYAGYAAHPNDKRKPKCRISGGHRYPLYHADKDDPCAFEKTLISYVKHVDCNKFNFQTVNTKSKYDIAVIRGKRTAVITTATSLMNQMETNRKQGRSFKDVIHAWERLPDQYEFYDGINNNDPEARNRGSSAMHLSILIAQDGKPYAWADGYFTGYNNGRPPSDKEKCINSGDWAGTMAKFGSVTEGGWGFFHEWGHIYDNNQVVVGETTNNLYSLMMERYYDVRPNRIERENKIVALFDYTSDPKNLGLWNHLFIMRQFEMFYGQDKFHSEFMRFVRTNKHKEMGYNLTELFDQSRWPHVASLFSGYDVYDLYRPHYFDWDSHYKYSEPIFKAFKVNKKMPNTVQYINDRFQYNLENKLKDQKGCALENNKAYIKQLRINDQKAHLTLGIEGVPGDEFVEILGYEVKNKDGKLTNFFRSNTISVAAGGSINYIVTPVTLKLRRLPPVRVMADTDFSNKYIDRTKWKIDTYPKGVGYQDGGTIESAIDDDEKTCYFSPKVNYPHGFLLDLGETTDFYGFRYLRDSSSYGHGKKVTIEHSMDNENWNSFPKAYNATFTLDADPIRSEYPKIQVYKEKFTARYIRAIQEELDTQGTRHFRLCDFKLIKQVEYSTQDVTNDPDYLARSDICNEVREQEPFLKRDRYVPLPKNPCAPPGNVTEDEWEEDFIPPNTEFHWPEDQGGNDPEPNKPKSNIIAIAVGVSVGVVMVIIAVVVLVFVIRNRKVENSSGELGGGSFNI